MARGLSHPDHHDSADDRDSRRRVGLAFLLTAGFMLVEVAGGLLSGSLALIADAGHMLTDAASLGLAWSAFVYSRRPADARRSYGYRRVQVLAAFVNGLALVVIVAWILVEAVERLLEPVEVAAGPMMAVATLGLLVNVAAFAILHRRGSDNLNVRGAALHVLGDLLGSVAALVAAGVILATGWMPIDPLLSLVVALLVLRSGWILVRDAGHVLLEGTPADVDPEAIRRTLRDQVPGARDVHHVHVWALTPADRLATLHVRLAPGADAAAALAASHAILKDRFGIGHATVQIEPDTGQPG